MREKQPRIADHVQAIIRDQGLSLDSHKISDLLVSIVKMVAMKRKYFHKPHHVLYCK